MQQEIRRSEGQEILWVGHINHDRFVGSVEVFARGSLASAAAPSEFCERGDIVIYNHPSGSLRPSDADAGVAAQLAELGIGSAIVDTDVTVIHVMVEPVVPDEIAPIEGEKLAGVLKDGGSIAKVLPGFRERPSQVEMLRAIVRGFNGDRIVTAEAGTGVGKSFAYLIPAVAWAAQNNERVVIATATINLQQQLLTKDLVKVQRALGTHVPTALVKGRGNYLCPRRLTEYHEEESLFRNTTETEALWEWAASTPTGSRSDLPFYVADDVWGKVNSETDACFVARCPNRERCFILNSRREANAAKILVANHHLVFSDLALRRAGVGWENTAVLPPFQRIIFDEAHNIERAATSFFSQSTSYYAITRQIGRILRKRGTRRFGLLDKLAAFGGEASQILAVETELERVKQRAETFNDELVAFVGEEASWRLTPETIDRFRRGIAPEFVETGNALQTLTARMTAVARSIDDTYREDSTYLQYVAAIRRVNVIANLLNRFTTGDQEPDHVFWFDRRRDPRGRDWIGMTITPLDLTQMMDEAVFDPYPTIVMTSATLAVNGSFEFWGSRIGVPHDTDRVTEGRFPSPFRYDERVLLGVPQDAPAPDAATYQSYVETMIERGVNAVGGGALILFTSYKQLRSVFDAVAPDLERRGFTCYRQGSDDRDRLMGLFVEDISGVLFATDSFWEGIDAPGETLRLVIVCRLPFRVPTDPVQEARSEAIDATGGNSFYDFSLPQAVMRLKQGFGRLMRRNDDYGVVIVTDPRIVRKPYGRVFWNSLPRARPVIAPGEELVEEVVAHVRRFQT